MHQLYQDAMSIVRAYSSNPDYFITFTCNPKWPEITSELFPHQTAVDRPDLTARVFHIKLQELLDDLLKKKVLGEVVAMIHVIEFQKRGLPHAHILLIMSPDHKPENPSDYDKYISAEIPNPETHPAAYETVKNTMLHGPCGVANMASPCMEGGVCSKGYPKPFLEHTTNGPNGYPQYRRRNDGRTIRIDGRGVFDNCWVVPHNLYLAAKYGAHINIESCTSSSAIKYLFKYIYKGHDRATVVIQQPAQDGVQAGNVPREIDEIIDFIDGRYVSASEAAWRIYGFRMHSAYPSVTRLHIHLPGQFMHAFRPDEPIADVLERAALERSSLTAFFNYNRDHPNEPASLYHDFPRTHVYLKRDKRWKFRERGCTVGRLYYVHATAGELFYLRLLLISVKSPKSFEDLRTVENVVHPTFKNACDALGLLKDDQEWETSLRDAAVSQTGYQLRITFAEILAFCNPGDPARLWNTFRDVLSDDLHPKQRDATSDAQREEFADRRANAALIHLQILLRHLNKTLDDYQGMPKPVILEEHDPNANAFIADELNYSLPSAEELAMMERSLNSDQRSAYDRIKHSYETGSSEAYFIDGPAGTGKTFLYSLILSMVRSNRHIALAVAGSGIAALLLQGGRTAHSRFKIPVPTHEDSVCSVNHRSPTAHLLIQAKIIVWDEAPMTHRHVFEAVDRTLKDLMKTVDPENEHRPFGGKLMVFGGDFRQIPPVIKQGRREETVGACLKRSSLWPHIQHLRLSANMRLLRNANAPDIEEQTEFANWLLQVGDGRVPGPSPDHGISTTITLPPQMVMPANADIDSLIAKVYPDLNRNVGNAQYLNKRAVLCPTNDDVDEVNNRIMSAIDGESRDFLSQDSVIDDEDGRGENLFPVEFLQGLKSSSLPPHRLRLTVGCPIILLRNIMPPEGLCNGTRLICTSFTRYILKATIITGTHAGAQVSVPRIPMCPSDLDMPFKFQRLQFPVRPAFAMTINKSQGQTLETVGIYLKKPVFAHGQLYVALSRVTNRNNVHVLIEGQDADTRYDCTTNVVYPEILREFA